MLFTKRTGCASLLFFRTKTGFEQAIDQADLNPASVVDLRKLAKAQAGNKAAVTSPVLAMEPDGTAVVQRDF